MCYSDGSVAASAIRQVCAASQEALFDCNHDDYYNTSPAAGSYLATHWNSANTVFLTSATPGGAPTTTTVPPTTVQTTTTTTNPPPTTTVPPTTTTPPPSTTVPPTTVPPTTVPPITTTMVPTTPGAKPSAQVLLANQPVSGSGVVLSWQPPATGPVTGYRVYRSTSPFALGLLAGVGNVTQFADTTAARGVLYCYTVTAVNAAGEGPASNLNGMVGR